MSLARALGAVCTLTQAGDSPDAWADSGVRARVAVIRRARHLLAERAMELAASISPLLARNATDTLTAEVLPLLDAMKFLEREAEGILAPRKLGSRGRAFWLGGVEAEVQRVPVGRVLVIGPANFPLFLPGVQVMQALAAGNAVVWKPGAGGAQAAALVETALLEAGLPSGLLRVADESVTAGEQELGRGADKVVFTGSFAAGSSVLAKLAETATPAVMELSGADAVFVVPGADVERVAKAVAFGLRLNGGAVCMSPRRVFADRATMALLRPALLHELETLASVTISEATAARLAELLKEATAGGASVHGDVEAMAQKPLVVSGATASMGITRADVFAPVVSLMEAGSMLEGLAMYEACPYALTASVFCATKDEAKARKLASRLKAGTVVINDLIAPTADARLPFGGRGASGYGVTRGAEGLLEMTAVKTLIVRRRGAMRHLQPTQASDASLLAGIIRLAHGGTLRDRWRALVDVMRAGRARGK